MRSPWFMRLRRCTPSSLKTRSCLLPFPHYHLYGERHSALILHIGSAFILGLKEFCEVVGRLVLLTTHSCSQSGKSGTSSGTMSWVQKQHRGTPLYSRECEVMGSDSFALACSSPKEAFFSSTAFQLATPVRLSTLNHNSHKAHCFFFVGTAAISTSRVSHGPGSCPVA